MPFSHDDVAIHLPIHRTTAEKGDGVMTWTIGDVREWREERGGREEKREGEGEERKEEGERCCRLLWVRWVEGEGRGGHQHVKGKGRESPHCEGLMSQQAEGEGPATPIACVRCGWGRPRVGGKEMHAQSLRERLSTKQTNSQGE
jgi:hypothetical protein